MTVRFLTSGESHGKCLNTIIDGIPAGIPVCADFLNKELKRRQTGYGRGKRMEIETDTAEIKSGIRHGITIGSPVCIEIKNNDWANWETAMSTESQDLTNENIKEIIDSKKITKLRPGHADYAGAVKYNFKDIRNVLERSSARETAARTVVGAVCKALLAQFDITGFSHVVEIGKIQANIDSLNFNDIRKNAENSDLRCADITAYESMKKEIDRAKEQGVSLGGKVQIIFENLPVGLGSYVQWDKRLDGLLAQALMSIPAVKAVEMGIGTKAGEEIGTNVHDEIFYNGKIAHKTNNAGGLEGGMTNGEPLVITVTMKPIPTMVNALKSIDFITKEEISAHVERADVCAVPACGVVAEAMCAFVITNAFLDKFGSDNLEEIKANFLNYKAYLEQL